MRGLGNVGDGPRAVPNEVRINPQRTTTGGSLQSALFCDNLHGIIVIVGDGPCAVPNEARINPNGQPRGVVPTIRTDYE